MAVIFCGYKSCGKTTLGKQFAGYCQSEFIDTDALIENNFNALRDEALSIGEIASLLGSTKFRELEARVIQSLRPQAFCIIATGGGAVLNSENVKHLQSIGTLVYLKVGKQQLQQRILNAEILPSFIRPESVFEDLQMYLDSRELLYQSIADIVLEATDKSSVELVKQLAAYRCVYGE